MARHPPLKLYVYIVGRSSSAFPLTIKRTLTVGELKDEIVAEKPKTLEDLEADELILYKVNLPDDGDVEQMKQRVLQIPREELSAPTAPLSDPFPDKPPARTISIIVRIPGTDNLWSKLSEPSEFDPYVTFRAPSRGSFGGLLTALPDNNISKSENPPGFITTLQGSLLQKRKLNILTAQTLQRYLDQKFDAYFTDASEEEVSDNECRTYLGVYETPVKGGDALAAHDTCGETYAHFFLMEPAFNFRQCLGDGAAYSFGKSWKFSLIAEVSEGSRREVQNTYSYRPKSDFCMNLNYIPIILLEICSDRTADILCELDRPRLLLQAACVVRFWNYITKRRDNVVMAVYIDKHLGVSRYLLFERNDSDSSPKPVEYMLTKFNLRVPLQAFEFLFQLYNFVSKMKTVAGQSKSTQIGKALADMINKDLPPFTASPKNSRTLKRQNDGDGSKGGRGGAKRQNRGVRTLDQPYVFDALAEKGYHIQLEEEIEGWTPRHPLKPTLSRAKSRRGLVMLKLLDEASIELRILKFLNSIKSPANHVIPLLDSFRLEVGTVVALPIASPLDCSDFTTPSVGLSLMYQLVKAVTFIHANLVAHLDLKPNNVLISFTNNRPRLVVIDFGVSVFVDSPDTQIEGFVGTPGLVAPEVGTEHGRPQRYSPIRADLWACGQLLSHIAYQSKVREPSIIQLAADLSSDDPLQRPLLQPETPLTEVTKAPKHLSRHRGVGLKTNVSNRQFSRPDAMPQVCIVSYA